MKYTILKKGNNLRLKSIAAVIFGFFCFQSASGQNLSGNEAIHKLQIAEFAISNLYVDEVDENKLVESAITGMLENLDPHSTYSDAEEVKKMNEPLQGNFEGIGVQFNMVEDTLLIIQPVANGPSEKVGIMAGDRIIQVNDTLIAGVKMTNEEIMSRLKGPKGSKVKVSILRRGINELLPFTIIRDKIPLYSITATYMIEPDIGYIRIDRFGATTTEEFKSALATLQKKGMKNLILDLQDNGGGYLNAAIELSNEFLQQKELIVYTEGRRTPRSDFFAKGDGKFKNGKLVVLINEFSASASEITAGAVQDWDRGIIVGRRSFGKGLVQRPIDLPDGSMIRLTVARYYTPSGRSIQKPYESPDEYNQDLINRYNSGEMMSADSIHFPDSLQTKTLKLGRTIYGGGGIMPDYFVPIDTTRYTNYHRQLVAKNIVLGTTMKYIDHNRKDLQNRFKNFDSFNREFVVDDSLLDPLLKAATEAGIEFNQEQYQRSLPLLKTQLKALLARDLWDMSEYFHVMNTSNETMRKALEIIQSDQFDALLRKEGQP